MYNRGTRRKITLIDRLRGWHWCGTEKVRNWCGCIINDKECNEPRNV